MFFFSSVLFLAVFVNMSAGQGNNMSMDEKNKAFER